MTELFVSVYVTLVAVIGTLFIMSALLFKKDLERSDFGMFPKIRRWLILGTIVLMTELVITGLLYQFSFYHLFLGDIGVIVSVASFAIVTEIAIHQLYKLIYVNKRTKWSHMVGETMKKLDLCGKVIPGSKLNKTKLFMFEWITLITVSFVIYGVTLQNTIIACLFSAMYIIHNLNVVFFLSLAMGMSLLLKENNQSTRWHKEVSNWIFAPAFHFFAQAMIVYAIRSDREYSSE